MRELLYALAHLQENRLVHGDIRPELIGVPIRRTANFRLLDRLGDTSAPNIAQQKNFENKQRLYMSPIMFKMVSHGKNKLKKRYNPFKSDVFSLGMVILEAGLLESVQDVYSYEQKDISQEVLVDFVEKFIMRYENDPILSEVLMIMLEFTEKDREEPAVLLQTIRMMKSELRNEGVLAVSRNPNVADRLVNQLKFTESGYELRESIKMNYSQSMYYLRYEGGAPSPDILISKESEVEKSLMQRVKDRKSQINSVGDTEIVVEDQEGEDIKFNSEMAIKQRETQSFERNEQMTKVNFINASKLNYPMRL